MSNDVRWLTPEEQSLWRTWLRVNTHLTAALHRQLQADSGLSLPDFEVLVHLTESNEGRVRVTDLARELQWERSRLSHHLTRMERRGLVSREECPHDRRGAFVVLTTKGRHTIEQAAPGHVREVRRLVLSPLDEEDVAILSATLERILDGLG